MFKVLLIGCGNIGALYDFENQAVATHAKAYYNHPGFQLTVYDIDTTLSKKVAEKYKSKQVVNIDECEWSQFDCISICTPTGTHFEFLKKALNAGVKLIICEKPVVNNINQVNELGLLYKNGRSRILVNYFRRFAPAYAELKKDILNITETDSLTNISVNYQRGFLNNCSHAIDLISFLFDINFTPDNISVSNVVADHFAADPTIAMMARWNTAHLNILGLANVEFSHFEIALYFKAHKIEMTKAGQNIMLYNSEKINGNLQPLKQVYCKENCIENYMVNVINAAYEMLTDLNSKDNFLASLNLNTTMLNILNNA